MSHDFRELQTTHCFGAITLRVPAHWHCGPAPQMEGAWCCCEENEESGTLCITLDGFQHREDPARFDPKQMIDSLIINLSRDSAAPLEETLDAVDGGYLWKRIHDFTEAGKVLRGFRYKAFLFHEDEVAVVDFHFVLPAAVLDDPAFGDLVAIMDREIRAARIEPFPLRPDG